MPSLTETHIFHWMLFTNNKFTELNIYSFTHTKKILFYFNFQSNSHTLGSSIKYVRKMFLKTDISTPLIRTRMCAYQGVSDVSFSKNLVYVLNGRSHYLILLLPLRQCGHKVTTPTGTSKFWVTRGM